MAAGAENDTSTLATGWQLPSLRKRVMPWHLSALLLLAAFAAPGYSLAPGPAPAPTAAEVYHQAPFLGVVLAVGCTALLLCAALFLWPARREEEEAPTFEALAWHRLEVSVRGLPGKPARVLLQCSGRLAAGELVALVGPSGGGKSTLLRLLAGETPHLSLHTAGCIQVDDRAVSAASRRRLFGYVPQDDVLPGWLTAAEAVALSARLRLPDSADDVATSAMAACRSMDLDRVLNVACSRCSGGERRRVQVAAELVCVPGALFLDEPVSGLDACHQLSLCQCLSQLARDGRRGVLVAIHTPSSETLALFDRAMLLGDGRLLWEGPTPARDDGQSLRRLFTAAGTECPQQRTLAEHLLFVAVQSVSSFDAAAAAHEAAPSAVVIVAAASAPAPASEDVGPGAPRSAITASVSPATQLLLLLRREVLRLRREPALVIAHVLLATGLGVWLGLIYFKLDLTINGFQNRLGVAFFTLAAFGFSALSAAGSMQQDSALLRQEAHRRYHPALHVTARIVLDLALLRCLPVCIYTCIAYYMWGFQPQPQRFFTFFATLLLHACASSALCTLLSALTPSLGVCTLMAAFITLQEAVFGGLLTSTARLPTYLSWLRFTSLQFYGFESIIGNEFDGLTFTLGINGIAGVMFSGDDLLTSGLALQPGRIAADILCLLAWLLFFCAATVAVVTAVHKPRGV